MRLTAEQSALIDVIIATANQWQLIETEWLSRLRQTLRAPPLYETLPRFAHGSSPKIVASFHEEKKWTTAVVTLQRSGPTVVFHCTCSPHFGYGCTHGMLLTVDLAVCPELRATLSAPRTIDTPAELSAARQDWISRGSERRAIEHWLGRPITQTKVDLEFELALASSPAQLLPMLRVTALVRDARRRTVVSKDDLALYAIEPRARAVLAACDSPYGTRQLFLRGAAAPLVLDELAILGAHFSNVGTLRRSHQFATVTIDVTAEPDGQNQGPRMVARWIAGGEKLPRECAYFDGALPVLLDPVNAVLYPVDRGTDPRLIQRAIDRRPMLLAPEQDRAELFRTLATAVGPRLDALPAPELLGLPTRQTPAFALVIEGTTLALRASLVARYPTGSAEVVADPNTSLDSWRDVELERSALARLHAAGMPVTERSWQFDDDQAARFWLEWLPAIEQSFDGLSVEIPAAMGAARAERTMRARTRVRFENDWFAVEPGFVADESVTVDFELLRAAVLQRRTWITLSDGTLARITDAVSRDVEELLDVLGAEPPKDGPHRLPRFALGAIERLATREGVELDVAAAQLRDRLRALRVESEPRVPTELNATLRNYQRTGLAWLQFLDELRCGGVLADDMGLGKTLMTIAWLLAKKQRDGAKSSLVIAPASVLSNWRREIERFAPSLSVGVYHGADRAALLATKRKKTRAKCDVLVTSYALLRRDIDVLGMVDWRAVIFDEAQFVKNADTTSAESARKLHADTRLALTGTPVENHLGELWSIVDLVLPGMLGSQKSFERRYGGEVTVSDAERADRLRSLLRPFLLRRTKRDVLTDLPEKEEIDRIVPMTARQRTLYNQIAGVLRDEVSEAISKKGVAGSALHVLTALLRLRQLACDPRLVSKKVRASTSGKRDVFLELVRELQGEGRRALVFSQFVSLLQLWRADLDREKIRYEYLDGSTTDRDEHVRRFQEGDATLFLISLKAGGTGLNLTGADTVIHLDPWWNPAVEDQATDRAHRMGQNRKVTVYRLLSEGSVEQKIQRLKQRKRAIADAVVRESEGALSGLSEEDIALLLSESDAESDAESSP